MHITLDLLLAHCTLRSLLSSYGNATSLLTEQKVKCALWGQTVRDKCFQACVTKPTSSLGSGEQQCLSRCMDRYTEVRSPEDFLAAVRLSQFWSTTQAHVLLRCASHGARTAPPRSAVPSKPLSRCCVPVAVPGPILWCWLSLRQAPPLCAHSLARSFVSGHISVSRHTQL